MRRNDHKPRTRDEVATAVAREVAAAYWDVDVMTALNVAVTRAFAEGRLAAIQQAEDLGCGHVSGFRDLAYDVRAIARLSRLEAMRSVKRGSPP